MMKAPTLQERSTEELQTLLYRADQALSIYEDGGLRLPSDIVRHHDELVAELKRREGDDNE